MYMTQIEDLLVKMLNIPSITGNEKAMGDFLFSELGDFVLKKQKVAHDRFNIIAKKGDPDIFLVVHMDTVPGDVPVKVTRDKIFGRGAIDNKGNIAGAIMTARRMNDVGMIFTVGEEIDFIGAQKVFKPRAKFIVMEPTQMRVVCAQSGVIGYDIDTQGVQMHSSLRFKKQHSAVYVLVNFLQKLYAKNWTAFNAIITDGGLADNIVSAYARAQILMRPKDSREHKEIEMYFKKIKQSNIRITRTFSIAPCESDLITKGERVTFFSEMAFFPNSVLFGVGNIIDAHTPDEHVLRKDLNMLEEKLCELITKLRRTKK